MNVMTSNLAASRFATLVYVGTACALAACAYLLEGDQFRLLITIVSLTIIVIAWARSPLFGIGATFIFLLPLGDIRRIADMIMGERGLDPLLLVGPIVTVLYTLPIFTRLHLQSRLSKLILALIALMTVEIFNPQQGSLLVGLGGGLFYIVPVLWFWIGRKYALDTVLHKLFRWIIVPFGLAAAVLGIYQTTFGFLPWEDFWIKSIGTTYSALYLGKGQVRSFGFLPSAAEYGDLLLITAIYLSSQFLLKKRYLILLFPILGTAIVFASMRGVVLRLIMGIIAMWAVTTSDTRVLLRRLLSTAAVGVVLLVVAYRGGGDDPGLTPTAQSTTASSATAHVTNGLAHPFDSRYSTAGIHSQLLIGGLLTGFTSPIGSGIGATTLAGVKFGNLGGSTEVDVSDAFVTMGLVGGLLFLYILIYCYVLSYKLVRLDFTSFSLPLWGILISLGGEWLSTHYVAGPIIWLCLGYLCRSIEQLAVADEQGASAHATIQPLHHLNAAVR